MKQGKKSPHAIKTAKDNLTRTLEDVRRAKQAQENSKAELQTATTALESVTAVHENACAAYREAEYREAMKGKKPAHWALIADVKDRATHVVPLIKGVKVELGNSDLLLTREPGFTDDTPPDQLYLECGWLNARDPVYCLFPVTKLPRYEDVWTQTQVKECHAVDRDDFLYRHLRQTVVTLPKRFGEDLHPGVVCLLDHAPSIKERTDFFNEFIRPLEFPRPEPTHETRIPFSSRHIVRERVCLDNPDLVPYAGIGLLVTRRA